ncbi:MAG: hypothetical protein HYV93_15975 [Candidatus Rokubacteria bacterium]|nr:hypothetical protein [Candidatus Rokubacteria bacterium]
MPARRPAVLFQIHNRRGLGHLMRGLNIAREIRALAPDGEVVFYTRSEAAAEFRPPGIRHIVESDPTAPTHWPEAVRAVAPDVVVYDTILPRDPEAEPVPPSIRVAYIMRRCQEEQQRAVFAHRWLDRVDEILVPHEPGEFGYELPPRLRARTTFVGPIVRLPDPEGQARLRERYRLRQGDFVLTSTVGGGGFGAQADAFFEAVFAVHRRVTSVRPLRHLVIQGPNYGRALAPLPGMTVVAVEPDIVNLLAISDLAIAEGGYNTVNEVRATRTPGVFLPSRRSVDDQEERVRALEVRGLARVLAGVEPEEVAALVETLCTSATALPDMRSRYAGDRMVIGNRAAAERILGLCR